MAFEIENGVLKGYKSESDEIEVDIPEGVTSISSNIDFGCRKVVLPNSLKDIEEGCFHQKAAFDGKYENATLVLYGVEISLSEIFANHTSSDWEEVAREIINDDGMIWDRQQMGDAAYEYYNNNERGIIDGTVKEINNILSHEYCDFKYIPYYTLKLLLENILEGNDDDKATAVLKAAEENYLKDFEIEQGVLKHYYGRESVIILPSSVSEIGNIYKGRFDSFGNMTLKKIIIPNTVKTIGTQAFANCHELREIDIRITNDTYISICHMSIDGCTKLERITVSDCIPDVWDLSGSGSQMNSYNYGAPYALKTIRYDGKYGVCDIDCTYKNARQKMKAVKTALEMLANKDFETSLSSTIKNAFISAYYVKTHNSEAAKYLKENLDKILPKQIKEGNIDFIKTVAGTKAILDKEVIPKYIKTADTDGKAAIAAILKNAYENYDSLAEYT